MKDQNKIIFQSQSHLLQFPRLQQDLLQEGLLQDRPQGDSQHEDSHAAHLKQLVSQQEIFGVEQQDDLQDDLLQDDLQDDLQQDRLHSQFALTGTAIAGGGNKPVEHGPPIADRTDRLILFIEVDVTSKLVAPEPDEAAAKSIVAEFLIWKVILPQADGVIT